MAAVIDETRCNGCNGAPEPPCVRACPGDVVSKDFARDKAAIRCNGECWDCYACVKACPRNAIQVALPYALARRTGELTLVKHSEKGALWRIRWPDGRTLDLMRPAHISALEDAERAGTDLFKGLGI